MIILRDLKLKDANRMHQMLNNQNINQFFSFSGKSFTLEEVERFINASYTNKNRIDYAIANEADFYMGTISLKNISYVSKKAEYAISLTADFIGKGIASKATDLIVKKAKDDLKLKEIYLNVKKENKRAIHFYEKYGFKKIININSKENDSNLIWYNFRLLN